MLSLFSGGGGLDIAFHDAGFVSSHMVEIEPRYVDTLLLNAQHDRVFNGAQPLCIDIRDYQPPEGLEVDFIVGGPPCQTFSAAGRRAAGVSGLDDPRGILFQEYVRILKQLRPKGFLFENVYGIIGAQGGKAWKEIVKGFSEAGYIVSARILDAADYGVPQHRERLIIVGMQEGEFAFPRPTHGPDSRDERPHYTAGLAVQGIHDKKPGAIKGRYGHMLEDIPPGLNYSFYTEEMGHPTPLFAWRSKFSDLLYKADPQAPVRTIKAQGGQYTGPFHWENRPFSVGELKRLQTFPDDYLLQGGRGVAIQQIGNSVPPQLGRMLAIAVLDQVFDVHFPFEIDHLSPGEQLSFRQRKRLLTTHYRRIAHEAIARQYAAPSQGITSAALAVARGGTPAQWRAAFIGPRFEWQIQNDEVPPIGWNVEMSVTETVDVLDIIVGEPQRHGGVPEIIIEIRPAHHWKIPHEVVRLNLETASRHVFVAAWKAFESYTCEHGIKADLVQLNGYYQYTPKMCMSVTMGNFVEPVDSDSALWTAVRHVLLGNGTRRTISIPELAGLWSLEPSVAVNALVNLRALGYEVRSAYTNSQIPADHVLIPYAFPTLTPVSVQLRKTLFPTHALTKWILPLSEDNDVRH